MRSFKLSSSFNGFQRLAIRLFSERRPGYTLPPIFAAGLPAPAGEGFRCPAFPEEALRHHHVTTVGKALDAGGEGIIAGVEKVFGVGECRLFSAAIGCHVCSMIDSSLPAQLASQLPLIVCHTSSAVKDRIGAINFTKAWVICHSALWAERRAFESTPAVYKRSLRISR